MSWNQFTSAFRRRLFGIVFCLCCFCLYGCTVPELSGKSLPDFDLDIPLIGEMGHSITEVSPPELIQSLKTKLPDSLPTVEILEPTGQSTINRMDVDVKLKVEGLKLFKDSDLGLGPHIALMVDDRAPIDVFDVSHPVHLEDLKPGTHTIRAIASYPWHESFKNDSAYSQRSFNILTESQSNNAEQSPILSTLKLESVYTAEPMILDFMVRNGKTKSASASTIVKATLNDQSFEVSESDATLFLSGLETGQNWLKLELQDNKGQLSSAPFSEQLYGFEYQPEQTSPLGQLLSEEMSSDVAGGIVGIAKPAPKVSIPSNAPKTSAPVSPESSLTLIPKPSAKLPSKPTVPTPSKTAPSSGTASNLQSDTVKRLTPPKTSSSSSNQTVRPPAVPKASSTSTLDRPKVVPPNPVPPAADRPKAIPPKVVPPTSNKVTSDLKPAPVVSDFKRSNPDSSKSLKDTPLLSNIQPTAKPQTAESKASSGENSKTMTLPKSPSRNADPEGSEARDDMSESLKQRFDDWRDRYRQAQQNATSQPFSITPQSQVSSDKVSFSEEGAGNVSKVD